MTNYERIARNTIAQNRRLWASRRYLAQQAAQALDNGAAAILEDIDAEWQTMENAHARLRHHARRLQQKIATTERPLCEAGRKQLLGKR